jgi:hypothetical protein
MRRNRWRAPEWDYTCPSCNACLLHGEKKSFCCNDGKWVIPPLPPLPPRLSLLLSDRQFSQNISSRSRRLNNLFAFTAIGATNGFTTFKTGVSTVSITGRTYHRLFDINDPTHSLHWFLYDEHERDLHGSEFNVPLNWIHALRDDLFDHNPYVRHLKQFHGIPDTETTALLLGDFSTGGDFAAIMHAANSTTIKPRSVLIWRNRDEDPTFIPIFSRHYEPLQYPLLFPHGSPGWGLQEIEGSHQTRAVPFTQREWYRCRLLTEERFLTFGRLASEYICDMYSRIEEERLDFIRRSRDAAAVDDNQDSDNPQEHLDLPASFIGSRKWSSEQTADSLALARTYGPPSLFITMTCNSNWPEIKSRLKPGQKACDAPIIVVRAFKLRLHRLLELLRTKFGGLVYMIKVIEFQKRGLPHAHIILKVRVYLFCFDLLSEFYSCGTSYQSLK